MKTKTERRIYNDYKQAAGLLLDGNLEWSMDMEFIRIPLGRYIDRVADEGNFDDFDLRLVVRSLIATENDISVGD